MLPCIVMHLHADDAIWLPAGMTHVEELHAPVSVRNLYFGPGLAKGLPRTCCMVNISPLVRELIQHTSRIGALDRKKPAHAHLISVLLDSPSTSRTSRSSFRRRATRARGGSPRPCATR
jgi:hypothetical protein